MKLEEKIKKILPLIYNYPFDANSQEYWTDFTDLQKFRDMLIHLKKETIKNGKSEQLEFIMHLVGRSISTNFLEAPRKLISYIAKKVGYHLSIPYEFCKGP